MVNRVLNVEEGITHDVFKEPPSEEPLEEGEQAPPPKDIFDSFKSLVYVENVVREPRMHYQKVPRLGAFMAVPLVYNSCLSDEALEAFIADTLSTNLQKEEQEKERETWEADQGSRRSLAEANLEVFEEEEKKWDEITRQPLITQEVRFVVCLDTLGQDRELTDL